MLHIFNLSLYSGIVPKALKKAVVLPIYKKGKKDILDNYRPISLLPVFSKLLEKAVKTRMLQFMNQYEFLSEKQFGYMENLNTEDALLQFLTPIYEDLNDNKKVAGLFVDITKAFDTVDHSLLLEKLLHAGFRGVILSWFESYLTDRYQMVRVGDTLSSNLHITAGVPQGSVLGPILFLVYINSLCKLKLNGKLVAFADDTALAYSDSSWSKVYEQINVDVTKLSLWFNLHFMCISRKTQAMQFFIKEDKHLHCDPGKIIYHSQLCNKQYCSDACFEIEFVNKFRYLGVVLDNRLKYKDHVEQTRIKLIPVIRKFYILRSICPKAILQMLFHSLFQSRINYGIAVWGGNYLENLNPLQTLQKYALRVILFKNRLQHSFPLFKKIDVLPLRYFYVYKVLKIFYMRSGYSNIRLVERYVFRNGVQCDVRFTRKEFCRRFFMFIAPILYNILPTHIKSSKTIGYFLVHLKDWLFCIKNIEQLF